MIATFLHLPMDDHHFSPSSYGWFHFGYKQKFLKRILAIRGFQWMGPDHKDAVWWLLVHNPGRGNLPYLFTLPPNTQVTYLPNYPYFHYLNRTSRWTNLQRFWVQQPFLTLEAYQTRAQPKTNSSAQISVLATHSQVIVL